MALALARFSREKLREMPEATGDIREIVGQVRGALASRGAPRSQRGAAQPSRHACALPTHCDAPATSCIARGALRRCHSARHDAREAASPCALQTVAPLISR